MIDFKIYSYIGCVVSLLVLVVWFGHHERTVEADKIHAVQAAADAKETAHVQKVQADATVTINGLQARLATALVTPPPGAVAVRVCKYTPVSSIAGPQAPGAGGPGHDVGGPGDGVAPAGGEGPDIGPGTELILNRLKAKIDYLQGYVRACQAAGVCETN